MAKLHASLNVKNVASVALGEKFTASALGSVHGLVTQYSPSTADPTTWRENIGCGPPGLQIDEGVTVTVTVLGEEVTHVDGEAVTERKKISKLVRCFFTRILCRNNERMG